MLHDGKVPGAADEPAANFFLQGLVEHRHRIGGAFELALDYNISRGGNSGIMFHVDNQGGTTWASGPECQLLDNKDGKDPQRAGWL